MSPSLRLHCSFLCAVAFALALLTAVRAEETPATIKFSDPAKPGTLKIVVGHGNLSITGGDAAEITVKSEAKATNAKPRKDGLRVLSASSGYSLVEKDNVVTLDALSDGWAGGGANFRVTVPRNTNVVVANSFGGDVTCTGVSGDLEIKNISGEIRLEDVSGGALVETMNGEIRAAIRELHDGKPLSFTSMNGEVVLRLPADTKANVRLRTQNGSILTDFDEKALVTKTESTPRSSKRTPKAVTIHSGDAITPEVRDAIREAARASAVAIREAAQAARDAAQAARDGARDVTADSVAPMPPLPPMPPIPPVTGGKLVTGTLNGGGPEIAVATMNGDVTLRQIEAKK
jgi:hypothetical protein